MRPLEDVLEALGVRPTARAHPGAMGETYRHGRQAVKAHEGPSKLWRSGNVSRTTISAPMPVLRSGCLRLMAHVREALESWQMPWSMRYGPMIYPSRLALIAFPWRYVRAVR